MITINPLEIDGMIFTALRVELPRTNVLMISNDVGYIMCTVLDVDALNKENELHQAIAGKATSVSTVDELLAAPLKHITHASKAYGWEIGMTGKEALLKIA